MQSGHVKMESSSIFKIIRRKARGELRIVVGGV